MIDIAILNGLNTPRFVIKAMENSMFKNFIDVTWKLIEYESK